MQEVIDEDDENLYRIIKEDKNIREEVMAAGIRKVVAKMVQLTTRGRDMVNQYLLGKCVTFIQNTSHSKHDRDVVVRA